MFSLKFVLKVQKDFKVNKEVKILEFKGDWDDLQTKVCLQIWSKV